MGNGSESTTGKLSLGCVSASTVGVRASNSWPSGKVCWIVARVVLAMLIIPQLSSCSANQTGAAGSKDIYEDTRRVAHEVSLEAHVETLHDSLDLKLADTTGDDASRSETDSDDITSQCGETHCRVDRPCCGAHDCFLACACLQAEPERYIECSSCMPGIDFKFEVAMCILEGIEDCEADNHSCHNAVVVDCLANFEFLYCLPDKIKSCHELNTCLVGCDFMASEEQPVCRTVCMESATKTALIDWDTLNKCLDAQGFFSCDGEELSCVQSALDSCETPGELCLTGAETCAKLLDCAIECGFAQPDCQAKCTTAGTITAQIDFQALLDCIHNACDGETFESCWQNALTTQCKTAAETCQLAL